MLSSFKIINKYFWKSLFGPGILFVFSILVLFIFTTIWDLMGIFDYVALLPSVYSSVIVTVCIFTIPVTINNLINSLILKRIGCSKISKSNFLIATFIFYLSMCILSVLWMIVFGFAIFSADLNKYISVLKCINIPEYIFAFFLNFIFAASIGMFILTFTKRNYVIGIVAFIILVLGTVMACLYVPLTIFHKYSPYINSNNKIGFQFYIVYFHPFWYTTALQTEAFYGNGNNIVNVYGSSIFALQEYMFTFTSNIESVCIPSLLPYDKCLDLFLPTGLSIGFIIYDCLKFTWSRR